MPFIVLDDNKTFYMIGLKEYENDKMFLIDIIKYVKNYQILKLMRIKRENQ